jgi:carboxymethylenebutenolidase
MGTTHQLTVGGSPMDVCVARPMGWGPFPAIVIAHRFDGLSDYTRGRADLLADAGYIAVAPDMFHRSDKSLDVRAKGQELKDANIVADLQAAFDFTKKQPDVAVDNIAILGHCMGGRMSFLGAAAVKGWRACVVYYGGGMFVAKGDGPAPFERLKEIKCPVIGFFGRDDKNPSPEDVAKFDVELTRHGIRHEFTFYENAGHGFQSNDNPENFREWASAQSWNKMLSSLRRHLPLHWQHDAA